MPRLTQAASPASAIEGYLRELAAVCGVQWGHDSFQDCFQNSFPDSIEDSFELAIAPHVRLRMFAWSISLSSVLWCSLIFAGREIWRVWR
jgi:hypothetical protein